MLISSMSELSIYKQLWVEKRRLKPSQKTVPKLATALAVAKIVGKTTATNVARLVGAQIWRPFCDGFCDGLDRPNTCDGLGDGLDRRYYLFIPYKYLYTPCLNSHSKIQHKSTVDVGISVLV